MCAGPVPQKSNIFNGKYVCWPYDNDGSAAGLVQVEQTFALAETCM